MTREDPARQQMPRVGERIRAERESQGISLRALARTVGLSASLISQIETGKCQPSVSTLYSITAALGVSVEDVFASVEVAPAAAGAMAVPGPSAAFAALASAADRSTGPVVGPVVAPADREVLVLDSGVTWERLGRVPGVRVDFLLVTYAPGGSSSSTGQSMRHPGVEYGYLIEGELTLTLGFETLRFAAGDAISFPSSTPHRYRNEGSVPAVGVWFVSEES
jgi:transcriptional regulator with XRE-family HTH domain/quercetin dioxygenase-like cupin family protein